MYLTAWLYKFIYILLHPTYWFSEGFVNNAFDKEMIKLLNEGTKFTNITTFTAEFGKYTLWIKNFPYGCFNITRTNIYPRRYTRKLLMDRLILSHLTVKED